MRRISKAALVLAALSGFVAPVNGQQKIVNFTQGHFDQWIVRQIKESAVIGGNVREIYEIGPRDTIVGDIAYKMNPKSPWGTSNVMAKVSGVTKCSATVFPEKRGDGYCARLDTRLESCKVLGVVNITVLAGGTIFLGEMIEPIKDTKNPHSKLTMGVPFNSRPTALIFDYKFRSNGENDRTYAPGFGSMKKIAGKDYGIALIQLQKRWEDENGNVFAKRVGTGAYTFEKDAPNWTNGFSVPVHYGDISKKPAFAPIMDLVTGEKSNYCKNSKGQMVPIQETGWAEPDETPTHLILQFSSSNGGAYSGAIGNSLWIDNVKLAF